MKKIFSFIFIMAILVISSCHKSEVTKENFQFKTKPVSLETIKEIVTKLNEKGAFKNGRASILNNQKPELLSTGKSVFTRDFNGSPIPEEEIMDIMDPLVENGRELQAELLAYVSNTSEWNELTVTEQNEILNMTDEQLADLSTAYAGGVTTLSIGGAIHDCVGVALGIRGLGDIFATLAAAPTASSAIALLKFVGKRYLSWISLAWMVWDFADCLSHF